MQKHMDGKHLRRRKTTSTPKNNIDAEK